MLLGVLQVREQRLGLVGRADLEVFADGQVVDGGEEDRVAHDAGDGVDDELVRAGAVDDAGAARVNLAEGAPSPQPQPPAVDSMGSAAISWGRSAGASAAWAAAPWP